MAYKLKQNLLVDGTAYAEGSVLDLKQVSDESVQSLLDRGLVETTNDEVVATPAVPADVTPATPEEVAAANAPLTDENATGSRQALEAAQPQSGQPSAEEIAAAVADQDAARSQQLS